jgi:hypothetical protein
MDVFFIDRLVVFFVTTLYGFCKYPKINIQRYFMIYIIFNDKIATDADIQY